MITPFQEQDLEAVMELWLTTNIETHYYIEKAHWEKHYEAVKSQLPQAEVCLYKKDGIVKGFLGITAKGYIAGLFVAKPFQGQGIGRLLLDHCKKNYAGLSLDVYVKNIAAISFYQRNGFHITATSNAKEPEHHMQWHK